MFLNMLILSVALLSLAMLGLGLNILIKKNGRFPAYRVGHNRDMKKLGITCVKQDELRCPNQRLKENGCAACQQPGD
jgi:hypothetical protein